VTHYWSNGSFMQEGQVLRDARKLAPIPGVLVQGSTDLNNLVGTPWLLERAWPGAELRMVDAGHETRSGGMVDALIEATDRFASRV
jgi:proline iminopeptidase